MLGKHKRLTSAHVLVAMLHIKVNLVGDARALCRLNGLGAKEGRNRDEEEAERKPAEEHGGEGERVCGFRRSTLPSMQTWRFDHASLEVADSGSLCSDHCVQVCWTQMRQFTWVQSWTLLFHLFYLYAWCVEFLPGTQLCITYDVRVYCALKELKPFT